MQTHAAHAQALRALARVSLTFAVVGCIEDPAAMDPSPQTLDAAVDVDGDATLPPITPDAEIFVDAWVDDDLPDGAPAELDAGEDAAIDDAAIADAGVDGAADAMVDCGPWRDEPEFWACCDAHPMTQSCNPWGPPMPPAFVLA